MNLSTTLDQLRGVGPKTAKQLSDAGLNTVGDIIHFLPRRHEDFTATRRIDQLSPGKVTIHAKCEKISTRSVRRGLTLTTAILADDSGKLNAIWFNQPYRVHQMENPDEEFLFSGQFEYNHGKYQLTSPSVERVSEVVGEADKLVPIYPAINKLKSQVVRKVLEELKPLISVLPETIPQAILAQAGLISRSQALLSVHFPTNKDQIQLGRNRLAFDELFELILASRLNKNENQKLEGYLFRFEVEVIKDFVKSLPFELTDSQRMVVWDILQDFEREAPMNRLLQGDVGSGKTVVAGIASRQVASHGFQTAIMAPTEILATQHANTLDKLLNPYGVKVGLLVGAVRGKPRQLIYQKIKDGEIDVVVGTHALLQDRVEYNNLGFVVIDEQHRFGVEQRQALLAKSTKLPHLLSMTATPIPRSLALTVYGELDISVLNQMPKGRLPIQTRVVSPATADLTYKQIDHYLSLGRQCYVICSLIEDSIKNDAKSVESEYKKLKNSIFGHRNIAMLHGKMKPSEKQQIMNDFADKKYDILISTTVVEVGVDVPNATVILIENADRFGLAQLHQLRGRVGRGSQQSYCYLMMSDNSKPSQRLRKIEKSNDGFYLAEVDMKLRGPGEIYGKRQSGALNLQVATFADTALISVAQKAVDKFIRDKVDISEFEELSNSVRYYQKLTTLN